MIVNTVEDILALNNYKTNKFQISVKQNNQRIIFDIFNETSGTHIFGNGQDLVKDVNFLINKYNNK